MKFNLKNIFKKAKTKGSHKPLLHSPLVLWRVMLVGTLLLVASGAIFSFIIFERVSNDDFINKNVDTKKASELINKKKLDLVLQKFDDRAKATVDILANPTTIADPSK